MASGWGGANGLELAASGARRGYAGSGTRFLDGIRYAKWPRCQIVERCLTAGIFDGSVCLACIRACCGVLTLLGEVHIGFFIQVGVNGVGNVAG